jgi:LPXTG-motif cell wall-anchored protein
MKGTAVITTTTTTEPVTVTEVRNAKVLATAGNAIIVRGQDGLRKFTLDDVNDRNITILREGQRVDLSGLKVGDNLTATIITRHPPKVVTEREVKASVEAPPAPAAAAAAPAPAAAAPAPAPKHEVSAAPAAAHAKMPKTGSQLPLLPAGGAAALLLGSALTLRRRLRNAS